MGLRAAKQEKAVPAIRRRRRKELAQWPVDVAASIRPQPHLGPFLAEHEELFWLYAGQPRRPQLAGQVTQGAGGRPAGIDPSAKRHDQRRQVGRRLAVELYVVHVILSAVRASESSRRQWATKPGDIQTWDGCFLRCGLTVLSRTGLAEP